MKVSFSIGEAVIVKSLEDIKNTCSEIKKYNNKQLYYFNSIDDFFVPSMTKYCGKTAEIVGMYTIDGVDKYILQFYDESNESPYAFYEDFFDKKKDKFKKRIVFDFDGVINSYESGWCGYANIPDKPCEGIRNVIYRLRENGYEVVVCSSRCAYEIGRNAIEKYLNEYDIRVDNITDRKVSAEVYIDDRSILYNGNSSNLINRITKFKPWYKK